MSEDETRKGSAAHVWERAARQRAQLGLRGVAAIAWSRLWMALAGAPVFGRMAVCLATIPCRPFYGRHRLARYHSLGFVSPRARVSHSDVKRGRNIFIGDQVLIFGDAGGGTVVLGDRVHLNEGVRIMTGQGGSVSFGDDTHVQPGSYFFAIGHSIRIGRNVQIAPNCALYPYDHGIGVSGLIQEQPLRSKGDIEIGDDVWLGFGVVVLSGVAIGVGAVIGAGAVVTRDVPANAVAVGSPARVVRMRD